MPGQRDGIVECRGDALCQARVGRAFALCVGIAEDRAGATGSGAYADGFRAAAQQIAHKIVQLRGGHPPTRLERDLRDAEIEARTLARVVAAAERAIDECGEESDAADALCSLVAGFFAQEDLPQKLRERSRVTHAAEGSRRRAARRNAR